MIRDTQLVLIYRKVQKPIDLRFDVAEDIAYEIRRYSQVKRATPRYQLWQPREGVRNKLKL